MVHKLGLACTICVATTVRALNISSRANVTNSIVQSGSTRSCSDAELQNYALILATGPDPGTVMPQAPKCIPSRNQGLWPLGRPSPSTIKKPLGLHSTQATVHAVANSSTAPAGKASPYFAQLYVIQSNDQWCRSPCHQASWELAAPKPKLDSRYALFEAAIWHQDQRVALYRFDDEWAEKAHRAYNELCVGRWDCIQYYKHRESRLLFEAKWTFKDVGPHAFSMFLEKTFEQVFKAMQHEVPTAEHLGLTYHGHGAKADGSLFEGKLNVPDTVKFLTKATEKEHLAVLNFGQNSAEGRWNMLQTVYPFADWILASELLVGGIQYEEGEITQESLKSWQDLTDMNVIMGAAEEEVSIDEMVKRVVEAREKTWHTVLKAPIMRQGLAQSIGAYKGPEFLPFRTALRETYAAMPADKRNQWQAHIESNECDVYEAASFADKYVTPSGSGDVGHAVEKFKAFRAIFASTHEMIQSQPKKVTNGIGFNFVGWNEQPCDLKTAFGDQVPAPECGWNGGGWDACDEWKEKHNAATR